MYQYTTLFLQLLHSLLSSDDVVTMYQPPHRKPSLYILPYHRYYYSCSGLSAKDSAAQVSERSVNYFAFGLCKLPTTVKKHVLRTTEGSRGNSIDSTSSKNLSRYLTSINCHTTPVRLAKPCPVEKGGPKQNILTVNLGKAFE